MDVLKSRMGFVDGDEDSEEVGEVPAHLAGAFEDDASGEEMLVEEEGATPVGPPPLKINPADVVDDEHDSEDEGIEDYKAGGYHPVHIGEVIVGRYVIIQKLGWGHFSTVWLARDFKHDTYVALKIQKSAPHYLEAAYDEVEILQRVARHALDPAWLASLEEYYAGDPDKPDKFTRDDCHVIQLLNSFIYRGPYGNHFCMVFEILGVNLLEVIKRYDYKGIPMHLLRRLGKQVLIGLDYLHRVCGIIHTDLKPENVLLCLTKEEITEIYEKGMLSRSELYSQRVRVYQRRHGLEITEEAPKTAATASQSMTASQGKEGLTKKQKRNKKKKERMKKKKQKIYQEKEGTGSEVQQSKTNARSQPKKGQKSNGDHGTEKKRRIKSQSVPVERTTEDILVDERVIRSVHETCEDVFRADQSSIYDALHPKGHHSVSVAKGANTTAVNEAKTAWRGRKLDEKFTLKIVDLGNACWLHHHFTPGIQTRQYRSPEVITGVNYGPTADVWSHACMLFEMLTGDFLFEPRKGPNFSKDDDHLAQIAELTQAYPRRFSRAGTKSRRYFTRRGTLRRIQGLHFWTLKDVLVEKYRFNEREADGFASFLRPMLELYPERRITARNALKSAWLRMPANLDPKMSDRELAMYKLQKRMITDEQVFTDHREIGWESEEEDADCEDNVSRAAEEERDDRSRDLLTDRTRAVLDRSFYHGGYVGFGEGIYIGELDAGSNFQFSNLI
eukprot:TRINITY_DN5153_c0_g1_i4.p1 TRINITY_DN5153_c0_g1~~TRINITY_DN5153_c0_g1_i4.p1  ORF type:complete len:729 (+),score=180.41 TRINITY_DN5153_c0_g1_i4:145-2331(+)